jgi:hypothetical protein
MPVCPECDQEFNGLPTICPHCSHDFNKECESTCLSGLSKALLNLGQLAALLASIWCVVMVTKSTYSAGVNDVAITAFLGIFLSMGLFVVFGRVKKP